MCVATGLFLRLVRSSVVDGEQFPPTTLRISFDFISLYSPSTAAMDSMEDDTSGPGVEREAAAHYVSCGDLITADAGCLMSVAVEKARRGQY
jgi:hypothetical protein